MSDQKIMPILVLCGVPLIMVLGNSMLIPILPQMKQALALSQFKVSLAITLFSIPAGVVIPFFGFLSDRMRRKPIIITSLLIYASGGVLAGLAAIFGQKSAYLLIMVGRIIQGIGAAGTAPLAMALAGDLYRDKARSKVLGFLEAANGLGKVISPILGSLIGLLAWWAVFFLFPVLCIPIAIGLGLGVKEPALKKEAPSFVQYTRALKKVFQQKGLSFLSAFLAGATVLFVLFGLLFYLSDHLEVKHGLEGVVKGLIIAIPVLAMALTSSVVGVFATQRTSFYKILIVGGLSLVALSTALISFFYHNTYILIGLLVIAGVGTGMALTSLNTIITSSCRREERGMITSLYGSVRFFGVAGGPPFFGFLMEKNIFWTFMLPALWALLVGIINLFFLHKNITQT
ncbi:MAG: MFS transporter [Peptococcia bacterium]